MNIDLNCDLCEGEPPARTAKLMRSITSANLACGGHAGDATSMARVIGFALSDISLSQLGVGSPHRYALDLGHRADRPHHGARKRR